MKGEVRGSAMVWILSFVTCGLYGLYMIYTWSNELKNYLGKEDINPVMEAIIGYFCAPFAFYRMGAYLQEAQQRAGIQAENQGVKLALMSLCLMLSYKMAQDELNKVWEAGGGAPQTY